MRDGITLATDAYLPSAQGSFPVVIRTAYNRVNHFDDFFPHHHLALVVQDFRGRYDSEGEFYPFLSEAQDGNDTLARLERQSWCNRRVGMFGDSYLAAVQFYLAPSGSPSLCALNPRFMASDL